MLFDSVSNKILSDFLLEMINFRSKFRKMIRYWFSTNRLMYDINIEFGTTVYFSMLPLGIMKCAKRFSMKFFCIWQQLCGIVSIVLIVWLEAKFIWFWVILDLVWFDTIKCHSIHCDSTNVCNLSRQLISKIIYGS